MTERGSRGSLKRTRCLEEETNSRSKLQARNNSVPTADHFRTAATVISVPVAMSQSRDRDSACSNSPAAKECRITRNKWSRECIKSHVLKKHQDEEIVFNKHLQLGRSNSCSKLPIKKQRDESQLDISRYPLRNTSLKETSSKFKSSRNAQRSDSIVERLTGAFQRTAVSREEIIQAKTEQKKSRKESLKRKKSSERRLAKQNSQNVSKTN